MKIRVTLGLSLLCLCFVGALAYWWFRHPLLQVWVEPEMAEYLDEEAFREAFKKAGVRRIKIRQGPNSDPLGEFEGLVRIGLALSPDRNPALDEEMLARGLTGPGYTEGYRGIAYHPDITLFMLKHRQKFMAAGIYDWAEVERRLITNTAVHEAWHAITQSTSHNPVDVKSVMYLDPGRSPLGYGWERLQFTAGHKDRLHKKFSLPCP